MINYSWGKVRKNKHKYQSEMCNWRVGGNDLCNTLLRNKITICKNKGANVLSQSSESDIYTRRINVESGRLLTLTKS